MKTISGTDGNIYQYGQNGMLLEETDSSGVAQADYIYLNGRPIADLAPSSGTLYYLHDDMLGTPQLATDSTQTTQWEAAYGPFGQTSSVSGTITQNLRLPGQYFDSESGWSHNGFRDYIPDLGRYVQPDPLGLQGTANFYDPRTGLRLNTDSFAGGINSYAYVANNPIGLIDPYGLKPCTKQKPFWKCVADGANAASLAALLPKGTPALVSNLLSNDFSTLQQLAFGPNRSEAAISVAEGKGVNAIARGIGAIPYGVDRFILGSNGAGTAYAIDLIEGKLANTALGAAAATLSGAKLAYDAGSYVAGIGTCAIWGR